jgi:hypothetical protein
MLVRAGGHISPELRCVIRVINVIKIKQRGCRVKDKARLPGWPKTAIAEAGLVASRWTAAKAGAIASLWPSTEPRISRYVEEMMNAHSHSVTGKAHGA